MNTVELVQATPTDAVGMLTYKELVQLYVRVGWEIACRSDTYVYIFGLVTFLLLVAFLFDAYKRS